MEKLTPKDLKAYEKIPTEMILQDIADTKKEIKDFQDERDVLMRNFRRNRARVYLLEGNMKMEQDLVDKLEQIIMSRKDARLK